jgi:hypothetical protein
LKLPVFEIVKIFGYPFLNIFFSSNKVIDENCQEYFAHVVKKLVYKEMGRAGGGAQLGLKRKCIFRFARKREKWANIHEISFWENSVLYFRENVRVFAKTSLEKSGNIS